MRIDVFFFSFYYIVYSKVTRHPKRFFYSVYVIFGEVMIFFLRFSSNTKYLSIYIYLKAVWQISFFKQ